MRAIRLNEPAGRLNVSVTRLRSVIARLAAVVVLASLALGVAPNPASAARETCGLTSGKSATYSVPVWGDLYKHTAKAIVCENDVNITSVSASYNKMARKNFTARLYSSSVSWTTDPMSSTEWGAWAYGTFTITLGLKPAAVNFDYKHHFTWRFTLSNKSVTYSSGSSTWYN